jgi:uroporphyrinogen-III decarboxylase
MSRGSFFAPTGKWVSVEDVVRGTKEVLRQAGHGGGLFIGSSSEIVPSTPVENILAFYETCRTAGGYPICDL